MGSKRTLKTHCYKGHEFTEKNTYITPQGFRQCRTCQRKRMRVCSDKKDPVDNFTHVNANEIIDQDWEES